MQVKWVYPEHFRKKSLKFQACTNCYFIVIIVVDYIPDNETKSSPTSLIVTPYSKLYSNFVQYGDISLGIYVKQISKISKQAEAEVVLSSSLFEIEVGV